MASQEIQTEKTGKFGVKLLKMLTPLAGVLVFLAIWQAGVMVSKVPAYLLPAPTEIARTFVDEFPRLLWHGWITTYEMLLGYFLAVSQLPFRSRLR
jgi:ABC-type nitrate/sulfonate/bicarbonate transport system permease component